MTQRYWFPAKRYGWGWGLPRTWEGWLAIALFLGLIIAGTMLFPPRAMLFSYLAYVLVLSVLFLSVCWLTGEPPRWRWGNERR
jgi:hypothetical protein